MSSCDYQDVPRIYQRISLKATECKLYPCNFIVFRNIQDHPVVKEYRSI